MKGTGLHGDVLAIVETQIKALTAPTNERIKWTLDLEYPPFTMNESDYALYRGNYLQKYHRDRVVSLILILAQFNV